MIGRIKQISQDFMDDGIIVTLSINNCSVQELQTLSNFEKLDVQMKKWRNTRSSDANAYFHVLVGKIADVMNISKTRAKNLMIGRYGQQDYVDEQPVHIETELPIDVMLEQEFVHCVPYDVRIEGTKGIYSYYVFRGSKTYDTKEMSILIDGTVQDAKELGIETLPPDELTRMVETWKA